MKLLFLLFSTFTAIIDLSSANSCSISRLWQCDVYEKRYPPDWMAQSAGVNQTLANLTSSQKVDGNNRDEDDDYGYRSSDTTMPTYHNDDLGLEVAYHTPVNPETGKIFVDLRIKWKLDRALLQNETSDFWLQLVNTNNSQNSSTKFIQFRAIKRELYRKRMVTVSYVGFRATLNDEISIGNNYLITLSYAYNPTSIYRSTISLNIPSIPIVSKEDYQCSKENIKKTRQMAGRWTTAIHTNLLPLPGVINVSFYPAPTAYCIHAYLVELTMNGSLLQSVTVTDDDNLPDTPEHKMLHATFQNLQRGSHYVVHVQGVKSTNGICVCRVTSICDCVRSDSTPLYLEDKNWMLPQLATKNSIITPPPITSSSSLMEDKNNNNALTILGVIAGILLILLLLASCLAALAICRLQWIKQKLLSHRQHAYVIGTPKTGGDSGDAMRLIVPQCKYVFILSAHGPKSDFLPNLILTLENQDISVIFPERDHDLVSENLYSYVHRSAIRADKILIIHNPKNVQHIAKNRKSVINNASALEAVYTAALSMLNLSDPKIIHATLDTDKSRPVQIILGHVVLSLPRDMHYLARALALSPDVCFTPEDTSKISKDNTAVNSPTEAVLIPSIVDDSEREQLLPQKNSNSNPNPNPSKALDFQTNSDSDSQVLATVKDEKVLANSEAENQIDNVYKISINDKDSGIHSESLVTVD